MVAHGETFETRMRLRADDPDRAVLFREAVEIQSELVDALIASDLLSDDVATRMREGRTSRRAIAHDDGFELVFVADEAAVAEALESALGLAASSVPSPQTSEAATPTLLETPESALTDEETSLTMDLFGRTRGLGAERRIAALAPERERLRSMESRDPTAALLVAELFAAYRTRGRYEEAAELVRAADPAAGPNEATVESTRAGRRCELALERYELADAEREVTRAEAEHAALGDGSMLDQSVLVCRARLRIARGEATSVLAELDGLDSLRIGGFDLFGLLLLRAEALAALGRTREAVATVEGLCVGVLERDYVGTCTRGLVLASEWASNADAAPNGGGAREAEARTFVERTLRILRGETYEPDRTAENASIADRIECAEANAARARTLCPRAVRSALALHGPTHPDTARAYLATARAARAAGRSDEAQRALADAERALATVSRAHPLVRAAASR